MARTEEVNRLTERVYKVVMEQFNPTLRNFVSMGKSYEKALIGVTVSAKGYFESLVKLGELASDSQGSKDLGDTLFQMAEVHRQIQVQMEETLKVFHSELLNQLEQKLDLDVKYLSSTLRKYQLEIRAKAESIAKCHSELKKLRRKCQMSKNPQKYGDREMQFVEMISCKQSDLDQLVAKGYTDALVEERRRYCFLVDRQCAVSKHFSLYHVKVKDLVSHKLASWQNTCSDPSRLPERAMTLVKQTSTSSAGKVSDGCNASGRPQGAPFQLAGGVEPPTDRPVANGDSRERRAMEVLPRRVSKSPSPPTHASSTLPLPPKTINSATSTLPARKTPSEDQGKRPGQHASLPRAPSALRMDRPRVRAVFSHAGGKNETLLSFKVDEIIKLLVPEAKDGWHYGESEVTNEKGWFPYSYTKPLCEVSTERQALSNLQASKFNSVSTGRLDEVGTSSGSEVGCYVRKGNSSFPASGVVRPRPFSMMNPDLSQLSGDLTVTGNRSPRSNPFTNVRLKRTVTNDRSAPALR